MKSNLLDEHKAWYLFEFDFGSSDEIYLLIDTKIMVQLLSPQLN